MRDIQKKILDILMWIFIFLSIIFVLWYIFGNSPTFEQTILVFLVTIIFTFAIKIGQYGYQLNSHEKKFNKMEINIEKSFNNMKTDINLIKKKFKI